MESEMNKTLNHKDYAPVTVVINGETLNNGSQESILNMKTSRSKGILNKNNPFYHVNFQIMRNKKKQDYCGDED